MKRDAVIKLTLIVIGIVGLSNACWAEDTDVGKFEYQGSCADCHGLDGKGKGPVSAELNAAY